MIGVVQAGSQARADRFVYIPQLGIFIAITWLIAELRLLPSRGAAAAGAILLLLGVVTARQVTFWMDGATLFEHTIAVTKNNACAYANAGLHRAREGSYAKALEHFQQSLRILPDQAMIWQEAGKILLRLGKPKEAADVFRKGLEFAPEDFGMRFQMAVALRKSGANEAAGGVLREMLDRVPRSPGLHYNLGLIMESEGKTEAAREHFAQAAVLAPNDAEIKEAIGRVNREREERP
jgi:tetratricopeptide (TPR) repeat protein